MMAVPNGKRSLLKGSKIQDQEVYVVALGLGYGSTPSRSLYVLLVVHILREPWQTSNEIAHIARHVGHQKDAENYMPICLMDSHEQFWDALVRQTAKGASVEYIYLTLCSSLTSCNTLPPLLTKIRR